MQDVIRMIHVKIIDENGQDTDLGQSQQSVHGLLEGGDAWTRVLEGFSSMWWHSEEDRQLDFFSGLTGKDFRRQLSTQANRTHFFRPIRVGGENTIGN